MSYCKNTTENNNWCKTHDQIDEFLTVYPEYFVHQVTRVSSEVYQDHPSVQGFPYFGSKDYFPTIQDTHSYKFGPVDVSATDRTQKLIFHEIMLAKE